MRRLERVLDNTYDALDGVKICGAQSATGMTEFVRELERRLDPYP